MSLLRCVMFCIVGYAGLARAAERPVSDGDAWITPAEASGFRTTPSYAQTKAYLERLAATAPETIHLTRFGVSPEGRDLMMVVASSDGESTPAAARMSGKQILMVQSGIHAGEIEGKDAALIVLRDLAIRRQHRHLLDHTILVWLPIFNVDGHEHVGPYNRINQNGPAEMGFRATAQNFNLNRDYMKADAPEMRDWLAMFDAWLPDLFMDIHTTDGADYQYDLTWYLEEWGPLDSAVKAWEKDAFTKSILPAFDKRGHLSAPYLELVDHRDITKGIGNFGSGPRFSTGYVALRNRAALLVETHMLKSYATRVRATADLVVATLEHLQRHPGELRAFVRQADADLVARARTGDAKLAVGFETSKQSEPFALKGYAFSQEKSAISGDTRVTYDRKSPKTYVVPFFRDLVAAETVDVPAAYLIPAAYAELAGKLGQHGIRIERIDRPLQLHVERYRLGAPKWEEKPFEGRHVLREFTLTRDDVDASFTAGALLVPLDQVTGNVAVNLLEPKAPDSLVRWGFFDAVFEQKEYADARVGERLAQDMRSKNPALAAEFDAKVASDPEFAKSPDARLAFFYQRSPWYDTQHVGDYPVVRLDAAGVASARAAR